MVWRGGGGNGKGGGRGGLMEKNKVSRELSLCRIFKFSNSFNFAT